MEKPYAFGERIERVVEEQARRRPGATAVRQGLREVSYGELWRQASALAGALRSAGAGPGDVVAVHLPRTPERVAVFLAAMLTGAAYLPLDPRWPAERVDDVVSRSRARIVVTDDQRRFRRSGLVRLGLDALTDPAAPALDDRLTDGGSPACVFYTSGSTGRPKGVLAPHRGTCRILIDCPTIPLDESTVLLQAAPVPWDMHSFELWGALLNGGRSLLMDADRAALDFDTLRAAIDHGVNTLWLTSSLCNVFAEECPEVFRDLRVLAIGGDRASAPHLRRILDAAPDLHLVNTYGPAECSMAATSHVVTPADVAAGTDDVPIGRPLPRTGVVLLDGTGEIALSGDGLALGYLHDEEETGRRFFRRDGIRHYRTGDRGELGPDGLLRFRGRLDRQFKVRGIRVEPGEVEAVLRTHPAIMSCSVLPVRQRVGDADVACAYTTLDGRPVDVDQLRDLAGRRLLAAMVPTRFRHVERLPTTANGKVDHDELRRLFADAPVHPAARARDPLLEEVRQLLGLPHLTDDGDLLDAGATSLDAIRLAARLATRTGAPCTIADVYRARSLRRLRKEVSGRAGEAPTGPVRGELPGRVPLSHAQQRFWLAEQVSAGEADNMLVLVYLLSGPVRIGVLRQALHDVVAINPVLRTVYSWDDDGLVQKVVADHDTVLSIEETSSSAQEPTVQEHAETATADWWDRPFDLEKDIPIRVRVCRLDQGRHLLCLHVHHVAFDGWSEMVFLADLATAYETRLDGAAETRTRPVDYRHYAVWERDSLARWRRTDLPFWRDALQPAAEPFLPAPAGVGQAPRRERHLVVPADTVAALRRATTAHGSPLVTALLTGTGRALAKVFDVQDLCVGTVTAGRFDPATEETVGYFVNPLAVPVRGARDSPPTALLGQVAEHMLAALEHARIPFDELVRELRPGRSRHPWFQVWSVLQGETPSRRMGGVTVERVRVRPPATAIEMMFEAFPRADGSWLLVLLWRTDGIADDVARLLLDEVDVALHELAATAGTGPGGPAE